MVLVTNMRYGEIYFSPICRCTIKDLVPDPQSGQKVDALFVDIDHHVKKKIKVEK